MRLLLRLALPLTLVLPAAACGGSSTSAQQVVTRAAATTTHESTAAVTIHLDLQGVGGTGAMKLDGHGGIDFDHRRSTMTIDLGDLLSRVGATGAGGAQVTTLTDGDIVYLRSSLFDQLLGADAAGHWLKVDVTKLGAAGGLDLSQLQQGGTNDPAQTLGLLEGVTDGGVRKVGTAKVNGVDTTEYRAKIDVEKALARSKAITDPKAFQRFVDQLDTKTLDVSVWIDGDGHVRRMTVPVPKTKTGQEGEVTIELDHFGDPVDVAVPPADQVLDLQQLLAKSGLGASG